MAAIDFDDSWNGSGFLGRPDHESSLTQDEVRAILNQVPDIPGIDSDPKACDGDAGRKRIAGLVAALVPASTTKVTVTKGIHRDSDGLHITVTCASVATGAFHVWLNPGDRVPVETSPNRGGYVATVSLYRYIPVGVTCYIGATRSKSPALFGLFNPNRRWRRNSFSIGNSDAVTQHYPTRIDVAKGQIRVGELTIG